MDKTLLTLILLVNFCAIVCQEGEYMKEKIEEKPDSGKTSYSFSYGVSDGRTGDIKTVWESRDGDTTKGYYSVVEPNGSTRTVEYSAGPKTGFQDTVSKENDANNFDKTGRNLKEAMSKSNYDKYHDFNDDFADDDYYDGNRKRTKRPHEPDFIHPSEKKWSKYPSYFDEPIEPELSDYSYNSMKIKHSHGNSYNTPSSSHVGYGFDPNCKKKTKKESYGNIDNSYSSNVNLEPNYKYPQLLTDFYGDNYDKYADSSYDYNKYFKPSDSGRYKVHKYEEYKSNPSGSTKYTSVVMPDLPTPEKYYSDEFPYRPKKKRPYRLREPDHQYPTISENLSDYVLVPKKKLRKPATSENYKHKIYNDENERPHFNSDFDDDFEDDRFHSSVEETGPKEVIRKIVKKRKPVVNLLDVFDI